MKSIFISFVLWFCLIFSGSAQHLKQLYTESIEAYKNKEYKKFRSLNLQALKLHPSQPTFLYNLSAAYALNNQNDEAVHTLNLLLSWNAKLKYKEDNDFKNLLKKTNYKETLEQKKQEYEVTKKSSEMYLTLPDNHHIEDLIKMDHIIYMTDVHSGEVIAYDIQKKQHKILATFSASALAIEKGYKKTSIWVTTAMLPQFSDYNTSDHKNKTTIYEIDIKKGTILTKIELADNATVGSIVQGKNGYLYATNSTTPEFYIIDTKKKRIINTISLDEAFNIQGITIDHKNNLAYIADYIKGIVQVNLLNPSERKWFTSEKYLLKGIDGISFVNEHTLLAIQNNSSPKKVIKINHHMGVVDTIDLLDNNLDIAGEPTNGKFYPNFGFIYVSNSQWPFYDKENQAIKDQWKPQVMRVLRLK
ncbi:YncE family protein [Aquimarina algiphila]|uniref:hypothetical protein n=1 Tax=Aquimarina algiphila TaxID=2047982 RepID=UPI00232D4354|nr:hypothetical protein [Aquimarina algiphila]